MWLIWPFQCLILTVLTMTKYLENLLRDSTLPFISFAKKFLSQAVLMILKIPNKTFFWFTRYKVVYVMF